MKTSSEIIDAINVLERQFPVAEWRCGDIHLWPTYRLRLYGTANERALLSPVASQSLVRVGRRLADRAARALWRVPLAAWRDRRANAPARQEAAAVFFSDGVSFAPLNGLWFDRVVDPVMQALDQRGLQGLKLTPMAEVHTPRQYPSRFVQPVIDFVKLLASRRRPELYTPQWESFARTAEAAFGTPVPTREWLQVQAARLDALAHWFGAQLRATSARCAFVNTYYSLEGQAFVQAAHREGLLAVDLQHGIQGECHVAYARWLQLPPAGFSTLPDEFWVWSHEEAQTIGRWSAGFSRHRARITGNPWMQRWSDVSDPLIANCLAQAAALRTAGRQQVLACLSWGLAQEETDKLIQAARLCDPDTSWWWRLHPVEASKRAQFVARLQQQGLDGGQVSVTTDLPLFAVVQSADVVVAHSSTVIQEAAQFGVPSVVTSDYGAEFHADLVRKGQALKATTPTTIAQAVQSLAGRPRLASPLAARDGLLQAAVDELFIRAPQRQPSPEVSR